MARMVLATMLQVFLFVFWLWCALWLAQLLAPQTPWGSGAGVAIFAVVLWLASRTGARSAALIRRITGLPDSPAARN